MYRIYSYILVDVDVRKPYTYEVHTGSSDDGGEWVSGLSEIGVEIEIVDVRWFRISACLLATYKDQGLTTTNGSPRDLNILERLLSLKLKGHLLRKRSRMS